MDLFEMQGHGVEVLKLRKRLWFGGDSLAPEMWVVPDIYGSCRGTLLERHAGVGFFPL
jgi:hypothetical protein